MTTRTLELNRPSARVAEVWLNRPEVRNAFNDGVIAELTEAFRALGADDALRAIVLGGHGKAFCAGADLKWMRAMADYTWEQNRADAQALADMLWTIYSCPLPVVGRIHGDCYAGGVGLAAVCDVLVAADGHALLPERGEARPAAGDDRPVRGPRARRAGVAPLLRHRRALRRRHAQRAGLRARGRARPTRSTPRSTRSSPRSSPTARPRCGPASGWCRTSRAGRSTHELRADTARRIADIRASDEGREGVQCVPQQASAGTGSMAARH